MAKAKKKRYEDSAAILQKIGERLTEVRKAKGYSNYETFAYENGIPRAQYGRYEKGSDLKLSSLIKVLDGLGISLEEFFKGE